MDNGYCLLVVEMKTTVGFLRQTIRGLDNDVNIELLDGKICIIPRPHINYLEKPNYIVDKKEVLRMARDGKNQTEIAKHFNVTRQAINQVFKELKKCGELK